eukprot:gene16357-biopygen23265
MGALHRRRRFLERVRTLGGPRGSGRRGSRSLQERWLRAAQTRSHGVRWRVRAADIFVRCAELDVVPRP